MLGKVTTWTVACPAVKLTWRVLSKVCRHGPAASVYPGMVLEASQRLNASRGVASPFGFDARATSKLSRYLHLTAAEGVAAGDVERLCVGDTVCGAKLDASRDFTPQAANTNSRGIAAHADPERPFRGPRPIMTATPAQMQMTMSIERVPCTTGL
jgi:hypothetical protein